jgi:TolA-binding protein
MFGRLAPLILPPIGGGGGGPGTGGHPGGGSTGGAPVGGVGAGAGAAAAGALASATWRGKALLSLLSLAVGAAGGAATHAWVAAPRPVPVVAPAESPAVAPVAPAPVEPTASAEPEPASAEPSSSAAAPTSAGGQGDRPRGAALRAERLLLETASAALVRGDNASAIGTLKRHAALYPKGELAQEREALLVQALAASGDEAGAQRRAKDFKKRFPDSLQQGSVDKAARPE